MARRLILAAALCALAAALLPSAASAHAGNPNFESLVNGITPKIDGFNVSVINGDDRLEVSNRGSKTVTIYGYNKEPYLRLSPDGTISVNVRSPAYYLNQDRNLSGVKVPPIADEHAPPQYKVVSHSGRYQFHDHRMHWMSNTTPQQVTDKSKRTKVVDWHVPLRVGSTNGAINGTLFWRGSSGGPPVIAFVGLLAMALLGIGSVAVVRRRREAGAAGEGADGSAGAEPAPPREEAW